MSRFTSTRINTRKIKSLRSQLHKSFTQDTQNVRRNAFSPGETLSSFCCLCTLQIPLQFSLIDYSCFRIRLNVFLCAQFAWLHFFRSPFSAALPVQTGYRREIRQPCVADTSSSPIHACECCSGDCVFSSSLKIFVSEFVNFDRLDTVVIQPN